MLSFVITSSTKVFHCSHDGHLPVHFALSYPQLLQKKAVFVLLMISLTGLSLAVLVPEARLVPLVPREAHLQLPLPAAALLEFALEVAQVELVQGPAGRARAVANGGRKPTPTHHQQSRKRSSAAIMARRRLRRLGDPTMCAAGRFRGSRLRRT